ncbi:MAG: YIEGIA family protein [Bacillota bacterium]
MWEDVVVGVIAGFLTRVYLLRLDYRQYPTYPHAYLTHLVLGGVASVLGAVAIPALLQREYVAVTFLVLAAQQFREIRAMERDSLSHLEGQELTERGQAYIETIARTFEARNYLAMLAALTASSITHFTDPRWGAAAGLAWPFLGALLSKGQRLGDIATVRAARPRFEETLLWVEDVQIMEVGLGEARQTMLEYGRAVIIEPKDDNARCTLQALGQRQALAHDATRILGLRKDFDYIEFTPLVRREIHSGRVALFIVASEPDEEALVELVRRAPVLESVRKLPLATRAGRRASD